jgi:hypothetical protein
VIETAVADEIEDFKIDLWHTIVYQKKKGKTQGARRDCGRNASSSRFWLQMFDLLFVFLEDSYFSDNTQLTIRN